ncbi:helix-hairpin-helix domain-containing protein [Salipiger abyssi]|uniref:helix-hairpin-helix domain-containing protein n=1 Tax=Salipiger abyssi TaxID=1250539 RepID=UPI001F33BCFA|nr:helix-hairpin-helix domain-containing protein [Salipiger abyssi]
MGQPVDTKGMSPPTARPRLRGSCGAPIRAKRAGRNPCCGFAGQGRAFHRILRATHNTSRESVLTDLTSIRGVGPVLAMKMREMGIESPADLANAAPESLTSLPRVQLLRARMLISAAAEILRGMEEASETEAQPAEETVAQTLADAPEPAAPEAAAPQRKKAKSKGKTAKKKKAKSDKPKKKGKDKKTSAKAAKKAAKAEKKSVKGKTSKGGKKKKKSGK